MSVYRLVDHGYQFKKIMRGKEWVGRVVKHADRPVYVARIFKIFAEAPTEIAAFELVVSKYLGFDSATALREFNRDVRRDNRIRRAEAFREMDRESGGALSLLKTLNQMLGSRR